MRLYPKYQRESRDSPGGRPRGGIALISDLGMFRYTNEIHVFFGRSCADNAKERIYYSNLQSCYY